MKYHKLFVIALLASFFVVVLSPLFSISGYGPQDTAALPVSGSKPQAPGTAKSIGTLTELGQQCYDMAQNEGKSSLYSICKKFEARLHDNKASLGCSDRMFYDPPDQVDKTATIHRSYTDPTNYAACYAKAQKTLDLINSDTCSNMKHGGGNWNKCTDAEDKLADALDCPQDMYKKRSGDYWTQNPIALGICRGFVAVAGSVKIPLPFGAPQDQTASEIAKDKGYIGDPSEGTGSNTAADTGGDQKELGCGSDNAVGTVLSWIICPVIDTLTYVVEGVDNLITNQLEINTNAIFCTSRGTCKAYYEAWKSFRNIALGLIVIAVLIAVISEALGLEVLDAYTIRKALPRILIAAIAITLSWPLMQFAVELSNDLGFGIRRLIYAPFSGLDGVINIDFSSGLGTLFFAGAGLAVLGPMAIMSYLVTALLAVGVAILVLILRQILITLLIILAPVAIVMYILPNTQRFYKLWWESFSKALLMFPLIAGMIAAGRIFSAIALSSDTAPAMSQLIGFAAYFAPYFMIPMTFKMSGAAMSAIGGAVQSRAEGGFARVKKYRADTAKSRMHKLGEGSLLNEDTWSKPYNKYAKRFNRASAGTANLKNAGYNPYKMKQRMAGAKSVRVYDEAMKGLQENSTLKYALANDDIAESLLHGIESYKGSGNFGSLESDEAARKFFMDRGYTKESGLDEMVGLHKQVRGTLPSEALEVAAWTANWSTGTGFSQKKVTDANGVEHETGGGGEAMQQLAMMTKGANGGDQLRANMIANSRKGAQSERRSDWYGMSFTEQLGLARDVAGKGGMDTDDITSQIRKGASRGKSRGEHITGRPQAIKAMVPQFIENFDQILANADGDADERVFMQELAQAAAGQVAAGQASPENAFEHSKYMNHQVKLDELPPNIDSKVKQAIEAAAVNAAKEKGVESVDTVTIQDIVDTNRNNRELTAMVYQYGNQFAADASRAAAEAAKPPEPPVQQ